MMNILEEIFTQKRQEVAHRKAEYPLAEIQRDALNTPPPPGFLSALRRSSSMRPALIAEFKRASPSRGLLAPYLDPVELAAIYKQNGAAAISVLTEERFFQGSLTFLEQIASAKIGLPLLRKDFIFDSYQLYEARRAGASAVLLIAAGLDPGLLFELHDQALTLGLAPLVEVHSLSELEAILPCQPGLVGINNRDLHDFSVKLETSLRLRQHIPPQALVVAESGIHTARDVDCLAEAGIDAILVGEALVTAVDIGAKVRSLAC